MPGRARLVAVTRPRDAARDLAREIEGKGWEALVEPLLEIREEPPATIDLADVQAVLVTSAHAVPALARLASDLPVFAVGAATARRIEAAGHDGPVVAAGGTGEALAAAVTERLRPDDGALLHLAGRDVRPEPAASLHRESFRLRTVVVYRAEAADRLSDAMVRAMDERRLAAVMLFSPRTASVFARLVRGAELSRTLTDVEALCISETVASAVAALPFRARRVAAAPERAALVSLLDGVGLRC